MKSALCYFGRHLWKLSYEGKRYDWYKCKRRSCPSERCEPKV